MNDPVNINAVPKLNLGLQETDEVFVSRNGSGPYRVPASSFPWQQKGDPGEPGGSWAPVLALVMDGDRIVHRIVDWSGGDGTKPVLTGYVGASGIVALASAAVDLRGPAGSMGWAPVLSLVSDGDRRVQRVTDWTGGIGEKPLLLGYIGPLGVVASIADAVDLRGPRGAAGWAPVLAIVADGTRRVQRIVDWVGGVGDKPSAIGYIGSTGVVAVAADAVDVSGSRGNAGWSPVLSVVPDGDRRVQRVVDWTGGEGSKPNGGYLGANGIVASPADAVDVRGLTGGYGWTPVLSVVPDGERRVQQIVDWVGGSGAKPSIGAFVGPAGMVSTIAAATDMRGTPGPAGGVDVGSLQTALVNNPEMLRSALGLGALAMLGFSDLPTVSTGMWEETPFSQTIPLNGVKWMPTQTVASQLTFVPGAPVVSGSRCTVHLIANVGHVPQFSGFVAASGSDTWAEINGLEHVVEFWHDGASTYYSIAQQTQQITVVPILGTRRVENASPNILTLSYSAQLLTIPPAPSSFSMVGSASAISVSSVQITGKSVVLTLSRSVAIGESLQITYAPPISNQIKTSSGGLAAAFNGLAVTNAVIPSDYITFGAMSSMTQAVAAVLGYDQYTTSAASWAANARSPSRKFVLSPAGDIYFQASIVTGDLQGVGLHVNATLSVSTTATYFAYVNLAATGFWRVQTGGMTINNAALPAAAGDLVRYRLTPANTLYLEVSKDSGASWVLFATKLNITEAELFPRLAAGLANSVYQGIRCNGVAA